MPQDTTIPYATPLPKPWHQHPAYLLCLTLTALAFALNALHFYFILTTPSDPRFPQGWQALAAKPITRRFQRRGPKL